MKKQENRVPCPPSKGRCFYCGYASSEMFYTCNFDAYVHKECVVRIWEKGVKPAYKDAKNQMDFEDAFFGGGLSNRKRYWLDIGRLNL